MDKMIARFPEQLLEALDIGKNLELKSSNQPIQNVYIAGMGGSGIGGRFVQEFCRDNCKVPVIVGNSYDIPKWVGQNTLAIVSSYSGNTEETVSALDDLIRVGAHVVGVTSGGRLTELARVSGFDLARLPSGWSSPRACMGYSIVLQLFVLYKLHLIDKDFIHSLDTIATHLRENVVQIKTQARVYAGMMQNKTPVIYSSDTLEPVAIRFRQQINENSKMLCWHHVIPEMNHNELVGWKDEREDLAIVILRQESDSDRIQQRIAINHDQIAPLASKWIEIKAKGSSKIERMLYLVHTVDWISWFLAQLRDVDATEIDVIDYLKSELAKS